MESAKGTMVDVFGPIRKALALAAEQAQARRDLETNQTDEKTSDVAVASISAIAQVASNGASKEAGSKDEASRSEGGQSAEAKTEAPEAISRGEVAADKLKESYDTYLVMLNAMSGSLIEGPIIKETGKYKKGVLDPVTKELKIAYDNLKEHESYNTLADKELMKVVNTARAKSKAHVRLDEFNWILNQVREFTKEYFKTQNAYGKFCAQYDEETNRSGVFAWAARSTATLVSDKLKTPEHQKIMKLFFEAATSQMKAQMDLFAKEFVTSSDEAQTPYTVRGETEELDRDDSYYAYKVFDDKVERFYQEMVQNHHKAGSVFNEALTQAKKLSVKLYSYYKYEKEHWQ